jgi:hypothetical protein
LSTETDTKIKIRGKQPSEKLLALIHEVVDTGLKLTNMINKVWEQGAEEGFSKEEIADIVRPIARQKGLNKNQVYYLTHKPELQEKSKRQYEELKEKKSLNIQTVTEKEEPKPKPEVNLHEDKNRIPSIPEPEPESQQPAAEEQAQKKLENFEAEITIPVPDSIIRHNEEREYEDSHLLIVKISVDPVSHHVELLEDILVDDSSGSKPEKMKTLARKLARKYKSRAKRKAKAKSGGSTK